MEEDDLYDFVFGNDYSTINKEPSTSSAKPEEVKETKENPDYAALFHKLLTGSRSQINKLKSENEELKKNLQDAISSGSVMVCPNCTHHFNDRQCQLRPRAIKKMRARNTVELEFTTEEDLTSWLYLNQLETNNDGFPTVMKVKVAEPKVETLKSVGSILPELVEKRREEAKREPIKLRIKRESFDKAMGMLEEDKQKEEELAKKKVGEDDLKKVNRAEKKKRKEITKREVGERKEQKNQSMRKPVEAIKRKLNNPDGNEKFVKTPRKESHQTEETKKPISSRLAFPTAKTVESAPEPVPVNKITPVKKRTAIVWDEPIVGPETQPAARQFQFKIPVKKINPKMTSSGLSLPKPKQKITFIPTAQKKFMAQPAVEKEEKQVQDPTFNKSSVTSQSVTLFPAQELHEIPCIPTKTEAAEPTNCEWKLVQVKKSEAVLEHVRKHAFRRLHEPRLCPKQTIVVHDNQPSCSREKRENVVEYKKMSLKSFGISDEGISILNLHMKNSSKNIDSTTKNLESSNDVETNIVEDPALTDQFSTQSEMNQTQDQILLKEFFPFISMPTSSLGNQLGSQIDIESETGSIVSFGDREETELMDLMREESVVPPDGDYIAEPEDDVDMTMVDEESKRLDEESDGTTSPCSNDGFCLEDVEADIPRAREDDELSHNSEGKIDELDVGDDEMKAEDTVEVDIMDDEECSDNPLEDSGGEARINENPEDESADMDGADQSEHPVVMTSTSQPRLCSDNDELMTSTPMTSTPKNDVEDAESDGEVIKPRYDDIEVEELDWNYTMDGFYDNEEEEQVDQKEAEDEKKNEPQVESSGPEELREDGEISDEEVDMMPPKPESPKKQKATMHERITYVVDQNQVDCNSEDAENDVFFCRSPKRIRNTTSFRRRRSSGENRDRSLRRDRHHSKNSKERSSYLKYRN